MHKFQTRLTAVTQKGFTLIELVIVIVIIGILAAVAIPQFASVSDDAQQSKANAIAGAVNSAYSTYKPLCAGNLASCSSDASTIMATTPATCDSALGLLEGGKAAAALKLAATGYTFDTATAPPSCTVKK